VAEALQLSMTPETRDILTAYARGVNHYLETHSDNLPLEFTLSQYDPKPWSVKDSILIALEMYRLLTDSWRDDLLRQQMTAAGDAEKVRALFPARAGTEGTPGSNAWVISGDLTSSGSPILASDPHLPYSVPSIWYLVHLEGGDIDVVGGTIPGLPGVLVGHNQRIAWGSTNLGFDVQDLYAERLDPTTGLYARDGQLYRAASEQEWRRATLSCGQRTGVDRCKGRGKPVGGLLGHPPRPGSGQGRRVPARATLDGLRHQ
jgi:penicillin amidase